MRKQYDTIIEGMGSLVTGNYNMILVEGCGKFKGDIQFRECKIEGTAKALGSLQGDVLDVEGSLKVEQEIKVKELYVEGMLRSGNANVYADKIEVHGFLNNGKEVSADIIKVDGIVHTPSLLGDVITLNYSEIMATKGIGLLLGLRKPLVQGVDAIECTKLNASHLSCKRICAQEIHLRDHCEIDEIECDGHIYVDSTCRIKTIHGDYILHS